MNIKNIVSPFYGSQNLFDEIKINNDHLLKGNQKIYYNDILSAHYINSYSQNDTIGPLADGARYDIKTASHVISFFGEHPELKVKFNELLEKESYVENNILGLIIRWKKIGEKYRFLSFEDQINYLITERFLDLHVSKWLVFPLGILVIITIFFVYIQLQ